MKGIFISYRRQDSQSAAGRLADHLREHLRSVRIFRDVETIEPGVDFVEAIDRALRSCGILLAIIGPRWLNVTNAAGRRRLEDPDDFIRLEIASALGSSNVRVIPVLVEGAEMPAADQLPDDLKQLARRNAIELTDKRWEFDVSKLLETVIKALDLPSPVPDDGGDPVPAPPVSPAKAGGWKKWALGGGILFLLVAAAVDLEDNGEEMMPPVISGQGGQYGNGALPAVAAINLTGNWQDAEGGNYRLLQQGVQVAFQGISVHGPVSGAGMVNGNQLALEYALNGVPYQALMQVSPDGLMLNGQYRSPASGESGVVALRRAN
ncbi:MAG: hypothetical protein CVU34_03355 [Betaproteobacteria bacterium HGW-Betaproteobacteria-7]|jgi:hypothetical protein|nr:MAG: hypothetical protein CVU34_03355 [Betaproteobacteria bacterium HGW-Betaproteobacteria-7]